MENFQTQVEIAEQIDKLIINYKKDSVDRKTKSYLERKITHLKELYAKFVAIDEQLQPVWGKYDDKHSYMITRKNVSENYTQFIAELRAKLNANPPSTPTLQTKNPHPTIQLEVDQQSSSGLRLSDVVVEDETMSLQLVRIQRMNNELASAEEMLEERTTKATLETTYEDLRILMEKITTLHDEICVKSLRNEEIAKSNYFIFDTYEKIRRAYKAVIRKIQEDLIVTKDQNNTSFRQEQVMQFGMRLPKLELPKFYGDYTKWPSFRDLYCQTVHENKQIPKAMKISYLKTCIGGSAAKLISNLEITEDNYNIAWQLLLDRYENKRLLAHKQLTTFLRLPKLSHESGEALKELHDTTKEVLNALNGLGLDTSSWDLFVTHILLTKVDPETSKLYEMQLPDARKVEDLKDFLCFLEHRFLSLETHKRFAINTKSYESRATHNKSVKNLYVNKNIIYDKLIRSNCRLCDGNHKLSECLDFKLLSAYERIQLIQLLSLCRICFEKHNTTTQPN